MLSEIIKKKIEEKAGHRIRYTRDCVALAGKISTECNCTISPSTIQRLFGFTKGIKEPRTHTLDIIASYIGYGGWDVLLNSFSNAGNPDKIINELKPSKIKEGEKFELGYKPNTTVTIEYMGKSRFKVLHARNSRLKPGDVFKASVITLHHPLFILDVEGFNNNEGRLIEAKVSGITLIKKV